MHRAKIVGKLRKYKNVVDIYQDGMLIIILLH
jgi:hypothetical protein